MTTVTNAGSVAAPLYEVVDTPDGPFVTVERAGVVIAAGWSADARDVASRAHIAPTTLVPGATAAADAVRAFYAGDSGAVAALRVEQEGTDFQKQIWAALRGIAAGQTRTYGELADALGRPGASRAVGAACGRNAVALFVPCHRVVGASGKLTGFAWGVNVKHSLLEREGAAGA